MIFGFMKKVILFLLLSISIFYKASAQESTNFTDTIVVGSIEKSFPGGFDGFSKYVKKNVRPPVIAYENRKVGATYVSFIIEPDGSVSHVCTILEAGNGMDEEAIRAINSSRNWLPVTMDNKPVRSFCRVGVQFFANFNKGSMWVEAKKID
jgi:hypothetical protein